MYFSEKVKNELTDTVVEASCCAHAMAYGMLLFGRAFNSSSISMMTDSEKTANTYKNIVERVTDVPVQLTVTPSNKYILSVEKQKDREKILNTFNMTGHEFSLRINRSNITNEYDEENNCCFSAFVRGAFLSCGTVCDPNKMYTLEFILNSMYLCEDFMKLLSELGIPAKMTKRRGNRIVYFKDSTYIEDILTLMGATNSTLEIIGIKAFKEVKNKANRRYNFDSANISRTVAASSEQLHAISLIFEKKGRNFLPPELEKLAELRYDNPELSLRELAEMCDPPLTRSSVNYKLSKIIKLSKEFDI